jgi:hypothetical protein
MDHITLLSQLYLAYKNEDTELAYTLRDAYPEVFDEVAELIKRADTQEKFQELLEDLHK